MSEWISVEDKLPPTGGCVLALDIGSGRMFSASHCRQTGWRTELPIVPYVTHWKLEPELPNE